MTPFSLVLFSTDTTFIAEAVSAGIDTIIVDWEQRGKIERQSNADTQINQNTLADLERVRAATSARVICRINGLSVSTVDEVDQAAGAGADEILLPMVRSVKEVETVLEMVQGRCGLGILVETNDAVQITEALGKLPLTRVYVGLNDLAIERKSRTIFDALADGTVEQVRQSFSQAFGFGGVTLPDRGFPIPCRLLIGELARLDSQFSFLRRSFHADIRGRDMTVEVPRIPAAVEAASNRTAAEVERDRVELLAAIAAWAETRRQPA